MTASRVTAPAPPSGASGPASGISSVPTSSARTPVTSPWCSNACARSPTSAGATGGSSPRSGTSAESSRAGRSAKCSAVRPAPSASTHRPVRSRSPKPAIEEVEERHAEGFRTVKLRVHDHDEAVDIRQVVETAKAVGDRVKIAVDANQGWRVTIVGDSPLWDLERAKRFADACADVGVAWIEEPLAMDRYDDLSALTAASRVPIAGGELHSAGLPELGMMIERRCYNIFQPDAIFTGGIAQTMERDSPAAQARPRLLAPHLDQRNRLRGQPAALRGQRVCPENASSSTRWRRRAGRSRHATASSKGRSTTIVEPSKHRPTPGLGIEIDRKALARWGKPLLCHGSQAADLVFASTPRRQGIEGDRSGPPSEAPRDSRRCNASHSRRYSPREQYMAMTFEQLYTTYFPDVYRFSVWLTRDTTQAEDVASETFVRAWARRDRLRTETLKGYLFAIARNIFIKHHHQVQPGRPAARRNNRRIAGSASVGSRSHGPGPGRARTVVDAIVGSAGAGPQNGALAPLRRNREGPGNFGGRGAGQGPPRPSTTPRRNHDAHRR